MILGTHRKISNWRSRTAAAVMIIGAATLSAPLIQADAHPEEELAGKHEIQKGKSVIKRTYKEDGNTVSEHYEITIDGDDIDAYKIGPSGKKTRIDVKDIEGVDIADLKGGNSHSITISDGEDVKFMSRDEFKEWAETEYPEWVEKDFSKWVDGDFKNWIDGDFKSWVGKMKDGKLAFHSKDGKHFELKNFPRTLKFPGFSGHSENVFVIESDDLEGLEGLEGLKALESLKGLEGLEKLEALKHLKGLDGSRTVTVFSDGGDRMKLQMHRAKSKLAAASAMLEDTEVDGDDSREMVKAKRELEKARKALKAAERALKDAE